MATRTMHIALTAGRSPPWGDPIFGGGDGVPGAFTACFSLQGPKHFCLTGRELEGEGSEDSVGVFEVVLPPDYKAGTDGELVINAGVFGEDQGSDSTIDAEAWRLRDSDRHLGDVVTTPAQSLAKANFVDPWPNYTFQLDGTDLQPGDRLLLVVKTVAVSSAWNLCSEVGEIKLNLECEDTGMNADDVAAINVDSTGGSLTLAKAMEVIVARCVGDLAYNSQTEVVTFYGRDGQSPVATVKLIGGGVRQDSQIP
jgi:hypothetical protein